MTKTYVCNEESSHENNDCDPAASIDEYYDTNAGEAVCVPSNKNCKGLKAIEFGTDLEFLMLDTNYSKMSNLPFEWVKGLESPLDYESVTTDFKQ